MSFGRVLPVLLVPLLWTCTSSPPALPPAPAPPPEPEPWMEGRPIPEDVDPEVRALIVNLQHEDGLVRGRAALALAELRASAAPALPYLEDILRDDTPLKLTLQMPSGPISGETTPGAEASKTLVQIGDPAVEVLLRAVEHEETFVRKHALSALTGYCPSQACFDDRFVGPMLNALSDEDKYVRADAADWAASYIRGQGRSRPPGARRAEFLEPLIGMLVEDDWWVLGSVIPAIGNFGPEASRAIPALTPFLEHDTDLIRERTREALDKISEGEK